MEFANDFAAARKDFVEAAKQHIDKAGVTIPGDVLRDLTNLMNKDMGFGPVLKAVDAGFKKRHRKDVMAALTKYHALIEKHAMELQRVALLATGKVSKTTAKPLARGLQGIEECCFDFKREMNGLEPKIAKALESLQEEKSGKPAISITGLEGDMNGAIAAYKRSVGSFTDLEKKFQVSKALEPVVKAMQAYSQAAARTQVSAAIKALKEYNLRVDKLETLMKQIANTKPAVNANYVKAVTTLSVALTRIKTGRGHVSMVQLETMAKSKK